MPDSPIKRPSTEAGSVLTHPVATLVCRAAAGALLALAALLAAPMLAVGGIAHAQTAVPADWILIPTGLGSGDQFRLIFISGDTRTAQSTSIGVYNTWIQDDDADGHDDIKASTVI